MMRETDDRDHHGASASHLSGRGTCSQTFRAHRVAGNKGNQAETRSDPRSRSPEASTQTPMMPAPVMEVLPQW